MSIGLWTQVREQVPANRLNRLANIWADMDAETFTVEYTNGQPSTFTFTQAATWLNAHGWTITVPELVATLDAECRFWVLEDGSSPPQGGWPDGQQPGRGGRR